jgi:hypothetical protein
VAAVRDVIVYTEETNAPLCLITIDFKEAFDRISHAYLYAIYENTHLVRDSASDYTGYMPMRHLRYK